MKYQHLTAAVRGAMEALLQEQHGVSGLPGTTGALPETRSMEKPKHKASDKRLSRVELETLLVVEERRKVARESTISLYGKPY